MIPTFADAIAADAKTQPLVAYLALEGLVRQTLGAQEFTLTLYDPARGVAWRSFASLPMDDPGAGEAPLPDNQWTDTVVRRGLTFVVNSASALSDLLAKTGLSRPDGCDSCLSLPIMIAGEFRGALNCYAGPDHFTPERVAAAETLKLPGAAVVMLADAIARRRGDGIQHGHHYN